MKMTNKEVELAFIFLEDLRGNKKIKDKIAELEQDIATEFEKLFKTIPMEFAELVDEVTSETYGKIENMKMEYFKLGILMSKSIETVESRVE